MALPLGTWGGTKFAIGWLPFGGYVEIAGMVDESTDADAVKREEAEVPADQLFKTSRLGSACSSWWAVCWSISWWRSSFMP